MHSHPSARPRSTDVRCPHGLALEAAPRRVHRARASSDLDGEARESRERMDDMSNTWMGRSARCMLILAIVPLTAAATTATAGGRDGRGGICTRTAGLQKQACFAELADDYLTTQAACINDPENARDCLREARWAREEMQDECREQHEARREFCEEVGEAAYAPDLSPELFQDPRSPSRPAPACSR